MNNFVLSVVVLLSIGMVFKVLSLIRGENVVKTPAMIGASLLESAIWVGWGVYLLARG